MVGVGELEVFDLTAEVATLVFARDSSIEEDLFREGSASRRVMGVEEFFNVASMVEVLAAGHGNGSELSIGVPASEALAADAILAGDGSRREVPIVGRRRG
jgi:hypothetical protein